MTTRILLLGGTTEARALAGRLAGRADIAIIASLAGRTRAPLPYPVPVRHGGFGGIAGLAAFLRAERIDAVIDATHPYAATISANAAAAANNAGTALLAIDRPPWEARPGDLWRAADTLADALDLLGATPRRVFVTLGRNEVRGIEQAAQHSYLLRSIDPIVPPLAAPVLAYIEARGPFAVADEQALMSRYGIEAVIAKNSGGAASYAKIAAARALGIAVLMLRRPARPAVETVATAEAALRWVEALHHSDLAVRGA